MYTQWPVKNVAKLLLLFILTYFRQIFPFYTPWKHQRIFGYFSGGKKGFTDLKWVKETFSKFYWSKHDGHIKTNLLKIFNDIEYVMTQTMIKLPSPFCDFLQTVCPLNINLPENFNYLKWNLKNTVTCK